MSDSLLHITNGDTAAALLAAADLGGEILPWRDVLHDGPVPVGESLESLSELRADYLTARFAQDREDVRADMARRDATLRRAGQFDAVVLWFEHDLYDQLQILQILDSLAGASPARAQMICIDRFPGIEPFHGLGQLRPEQIAGLWSRRQPLTAAQVDLARRGWRAFTAADPTALAALRAGDTAALPFLDAALGRLMAEYPSRDDGLPGTERGILAAVADGCDTPGGLFRDHQRREAAPFMGDWSFWWRLAGLCAGPAPLLTPTDGEFRYPPAQDIDADFKAQRFALTGAGRRVLAGAADAVKLNGFDRWIGGVHLHAAGTDWRYDARADQILEKRG